PRGVPQIEVTFDIDANGIVNVSALDKGTNKKQHITITASSGLNDKDIDKMVKDAEANAAEDKKRREEIETKNHADSLVYATEKSLKESRDKVDAGIVKDIEDAVAVLKKSIEDNKVDEMKSGMEKLTSLSHKMAEQLYKTASAGAAPGGEQASSEPSDQAAGSSEKKDDVVDAEFEEAKD
ncbi:MAG: Hsp70 family protein, partial [Deltaproteobacteria bacterium]|nr:Hsp70 family protein [Deltaproteobacteria bacterium]